MKRPESSDSEFSPPPLFDLPTEGEDVATPIVPLVSPKSAPVARRREAWDDIANHDGPFIVPDDEDQVFTIEAYSPNPATAREVGRIETNRRFGLTGKVNRNPEQDENALRASEEGHAAKEQRRIEAGMSPENARALRIVEAIRRGKDSKGLTL